MTDYVLCVPLNNESVSVDEETQRQMVAQVLFHANENIVDKKGGSTGQLVLYTHHPLLVAVYQAFAEQYSWLTRINIIVDRKFDQDRVDDMLFRLTGQKKEFTVCYRFLPSGLTTEDERAKMKRKLSRAYGRAFVAELPSSKVVLEN